MFSGLPCYTITKSYPSDYNNFEIKYNMPLHLALLASYLDISLKYLLAYYLYPS